MPTIASNSAISASGAPAGKGSPGGLQRRREERHHFFSTVSHASRHFGKTNESPYILPIRNVGSMLAPRLCAVTALVIVSILMAMLGLNEFVA